MGNAYAVEEAPEWEVLEMAVDNGASVTVIGRSMVNVVDLRKFLVKGMVEVDRSRVPAVVDVAAACLAAEQLQKKHPIGIVHLCQDLHLRLGPTVDKEKQEKKRLRNHPCPHVLIPPCKKSFFSN